MPRGKNAFEDPVQHIAWQYGILKDVREIPLAFERVPKSLGFWVSREGTRGYRKHGSHIWRGYPFH